MNSYQIQEKYGVSALVGEVLAFRQLEPWQIEQILYPEKQLHECRCEALDRMVLRILQAKEKQEKIFIGGDYDADGLCATTILKETLDELNIENGFYIPNRFTHGYGLHPDTVKMVKEKGYDLIMTVDNGVAAKEAIELAHQLGLEILITDHHTIQEELAWDGLLHPTLMPEAFHAMCGAGVALQLSRRLIKENRKHVILAMVATLADMMPLFNENRWIVRKGLQYLNEDRLPQLEALVERPIKRWDEKEVAFQIVPKLNAVGRLADIANPNNVVRYLLLKDISAIEEAAKQIKAINNQRKQMSEKMANQALAMLQEEDFCFIADEGFHEGLVGLIANKVMMAVNKPVAVFSIKQNSYKGSVRSSGIVNLIDFFAGLQPYLEVFGGHQAAAGIEIKKENYELFHQAVQKKMKQVKQTETKKDCICLSSDLCTIDSVRSLAALAPFGQGFEQPVFCIQNFDVVEAQVLKERYPKWRCRNESFDFEAISFTLQKSCVDQSVQSFTGLLQVNEFRGRKTLSILVESVA